MADYKFKDAGKEYGPIQVPGISTPEKYYPRMDIDLDKFPELEGEIGESIEVVVRGKVCSIRKSEGSNCMDIEIKELGIPSGEGNEADKALSRMKAR